MQNFIDIFQSHKIAPVCIRCGSFFRQEFFFCKSCFENQILKFEHFQESQMEIGSVDVTSLFQWVPRTSDSLSLAIHLLKKPESKSAWNYLGELFVNYLDTHARSKFEMANTVLIPVPGRNLKSVHTHYLSDALSSNLKLKKIDLIHHLNVDDSPSQKELSRHQRLTRKFNLCVDFTRAGELEKMQNIVLIDDVVTTGATLQACAQQLRALKPKANIKAWVMFKRL